jgi:hypothetical protein
MHTGQTLEKSSSESATTSHYSIPPNKKRKLVDDNVMVIDKVSPKSSQSPKVKYPKHNV